MHPTSVPKSALAPAASEIAPVSTGICKAPEVPGPVVAFVTKNPIGVASFDLKLCPLSITTSVSNLHKSEPAS